MPSTCNFFWNGVFDAAVHRIDRFIHLAEVGRLKAFESDEKAAAAAPDDQIEQFGIVRDVDAGLAHPTHSEWNQRPQEVFQSLGLAGEIVVHEENEFGAVAAGGCGGHLRYHIVDGPLSIGVMKRRLDRTEFAGQPATAPELDQRSEEH